MGVNASKGGNSVTTYTVSGSTLADIVKDMDKKGPVDPNESKRYSGRCTGQLELKLVDKDLDLQVTPGKTPVEVTASLKSGSVVSSCAIVMPKLASDKGLSDAAKKEWKRFLAAVDKHESGHADGIYDEAKSLAAELDKVSASATGKDEKSAKVAAIKALYAQLQKNYGGSTLSDLVNANIKAYDSKTKHGESQGAVLDGKIT